jgi:acyl-CoA synthetase (AMP-forming)/AMP-acid ligase II
MRLGLMTALTGTALTTAIGDLGPSASYWIFAGATLGAYKTPKLIKFVDSLPKGPSGKVQRLKLLDAT